MTKLTARGIRLALFFFVLAPLSVTIVPAADDSKPAQYKRLSGIKPFTFAQMSDFLSERQNAIIATINKDGTPQLTPVISSWDGTTFSISVAKEIINYKNLQPDPRVHLIVDDVLDHRTVIAKGKVQIQEQNIGT